MPPSYGLVSPDPHYVWPPPNKSNKSFFKVSKNQAKKKAFRTSGEIEKTETQIHVKSQNHPSGLKLLHQAPQGHQTQQRFFLPRVCEASQIIRLRSQQISAS